MQDFMFNMETLYVCMGQVRVLLMAYDALYLRTNISYDFRKNAAILKYLV